MGTEQDSELGKLLTLFIAACGRCAGTAAALLPARLSDRGKGDIFTDFGIVFSHTRGGRGWGMVSRGLALAEEFGLDG
jgi:hypothetical protein